MGNIIGNHVTHSPICRKQVQTVAIRSVPISTHFYNYIKKDYKIVRKN